MFDFYANSFCIVLSKCKYSTSTYSCNWWAIAWWNCGEFLWKTLEIYWWCTFRIICCAISTRDSTGWIIRSTISTYLYRYCTERVITGSIATLKCTVWIIACTICTLKCTIWIIRSPIRTIIKCTIWIIACTIWTARWSTSRVIRTAIVAFLWLTRVITFTTRTATTTTRVRVCW